MKLILAFLMLLASAFAAVTPDTSGFGAATATTVSWTQNIGSGANRCIVVLTVVETVQNITSVTVGGTAATFFGRWATTGLAFSGNIEAWYLSNPASGTGVTVTMNYGTSALGQGSSISFSNCNATPLSNAVTASGTSATSPSVTVTTTTDGIALGIITGNWVQTPQFTANQTEWFARSGSSSYNVGDYLPASTTSTVLTWTNNVTAQSWFAMGLNVASNGTIAAGTLQGGPTMVGGPTVH